MQLLLHQIEEFTAVSRVPAAAITPKVLVGVRRLHEKDELEPLLREILSDPNKTPHGPTEIADILTSRITFQGKPRVAAFVLKGRSFPRVSAREVTHQFVRLRRVADLGLMVFVAVGHIQDDARADFIQTATDALCDYIIVDAADLARLLIAYEKICAEDGFAFDPVSGCCVEGHERAEGIPVIMRVREDPRAEILSLRDQSYAGAKRYSATVLVDRHYPREVLRDIIIRLTTNIRESNYHRNDLVEDHWGETPAHVVWLYLAYDNEDVRRYNWICRTEWFDPDLLPCWRPIEMQADEVVSHIRIAWSQDYEWKKLLFQDLSAPKGELLAALKPLVTRMVALGDLAAQLFVAYAAHRISEEEFATEMTRWQPEVSELYLKSGDLPMPPEDVKSYDEVCAGLFATVDNLFLPFGEATDMQWSSRQRDALLAGQFERYVEQKQALGYEERKMH